MNAAYPECSLRLTREPAITWQWIWGSEVSDASGPAGWANLSGKLTREGHVLPIRVYFEDTDFSGVVYHTSYLRWCERGRSDYLRLLDVHHAALAAGAFTGEPCAFAIRRITAEYLKPARIDEVLEVHTRPGNHTKASIVMNQTVMRNGEPVFRLEAQAVLISLSGRLLRFPQALATHLLSKIDSL
jgi:acyl-CoA thioester hydrolase